MKIFRIFLLFLILSEHLPAIAQKSISGIAGIQLHATKSKFVSDDLVNPRLQLRTKFDRAISIGLQFNINPRLGFKTTASHFNYGIAFTTLGDYPGTQKKYGKHHSNFEGELFELSEVLVFSFPHSSKKSQLLSELGLDILYSRFGGLPAFGFGFSNGANPNQLGSQLTGTPISAKYFRFGLRAGFGKEWNLSTHHNLSLMLIGSLGLSRIEQWKLSYTLWDISPNIDPVNYTNILSTKCSFVALRASYRFQL